MDKDTLQDAPGAAGEATDKGQAHAGSSHDAEDKYRMILEEASDPFFSFFPDGTYRYVNAAFARGVGRKAEDIIGKRIWDVFPKDEADKRFAAVKEVFGTGHQKVFEVRVPRPDGDQFYVTTVNPVKNAEGKVHTVVCSSKNITERKLAESALHRSEQSAKALLDLYQSFQGSVEDLLRVAVEHAVRLTGSDFGFIGLVNANEDTMFTHVYSNKAMSDCTTMRKPAEFNIRKGGLWAETVRQHRTIVMNDYAQADPMKKGLPEGHVPLKRFLGVPVMQKGRTVLVTGLANKATDYNEADVQILLVFLEGVWKMVASKHAEEDRAVLAEQLRQAQKMEAIGRLAGGMAHDFNNLLTGINGYVSMALMDLKPEDPLHEVFTQIKKASDSAAKVTRQLLTYSRKQITEPKVVVLNEMIGNMQSMLERLIGEDIRIRTFLERNLWPVKVDLGVFEQVVVNLAVNARDAMPDGGTLTIETANAVLNEEYCSEHPEARPGHFVMLTVSDTGVGLNEEAREHLFEPFFTTKPKDAGTGLGLASVQGAVKQAGGLILVESKEGSGTTFRIYIPRTMDRGNVALKPSTGLAYPAGVETVVLVEDEAIVRDMAVKLLTLLGYNVLHFASGPEALRFVREYQGRIELVMTDVVMPQMNGMVLAQELKTIRPEVKVLFTSGYTDDAIVHHGVLAEGTNFIAKPYTPAALASKLREVLEER